MVQVWESFRQRLITEQRLMRIALTVNFGKAAAVSFALLVASTLFPNAELHGQVPQRPVPKPLPRAVQQPSPVQRPKSAEEDLIILRDRSRRTGKLEMCGMDACLIGRSVVARSQAEWIGLTVRQLAQPVPPSPRNSTQDEVFLADGSAHDGAVISVLATSVATVSASYPRAQVRWLHLTIGSKGVRGTAELPPSGHPAGNSPPGQPPDGGGGGRSNSDLPDGKSNTSTGGMGSSGGAPGSGLWVGTVRGEDTNTDPRAPGPVHHNVTLHVRLREVNGMHAVVRGKPGAYYTVHLSNENTSITDGWDDWVCSGQGSTKFSDRVIGTSGQIWFPLAASSNTTRAPEPAAYRLSFGTLMERWQCGPRSFNFGFSTPIQIGFDPNNAVWNRNLLEQSFWDTEGYRYLSGGNSRMFGHYQLQNGHKQGATIERKVEWDICRLGSSGCKPPDFSQDCRPGTSNVAGCEAQKEHLVEELKKLWAQYQQYLAQARQNQAAYRESVLACAAGDAAMKIATYVIGPYEGAAAKESEREINEFREAVKLFAEMTQKFVNGENPITIAHSKELDLENLATLQQAVEAVGELASLFLSITPESMREHLAECPTPLPDSTYQAALSYVRNVESALELAPELRTVMNNIRQLDIQCQDEQWRAYKDCVDDARCHHQDPSGCDRLKPGPNWPDAP